MLFYLGELTEKSNGGHVPRISSKPLLLYLSEQKAVH